MAKKVFWKEPENYNGKGRKNKTDFPEFVDICKKTQEELKIFLHDKLLEAGYESIVNEDGFIFAEGEIPILLTAHMDTVHKDPVKDFYEYYKDKHIISSPQGIGGDDRCGIYMILQIIKTHKPCILFCEDEEIGGIGSCKFCSSAHLETIMKMKYMIELDRKGSEDAVFYDCENLLFNEYILSNTDFQKSFGSFSDISNLCPDAMVAGVNLSCGYYNPHTTSEYVVVEEMLNTVQKVRNLLDIENECSFFEYVEGYDVYDDYYDYFGYRHNTYHWRSNAIPNKSLILEVKNSKGESLYYVSNGSNKEEALGKFFMNNPDYCFNDIVDFDMYTQKIRDDGWYKSQL